MKLIENLKWRYATKKFDTSRKVSTHEIGLIKESVQLAASSYGLQPYRVLEIKSMAIREKLRPLCWNQSQITDASHLFLFCNYSNISELDIDYLVKLKAEINGLEINTFSGYGNFIKEKIEEKTPIEIVHWTAKQTYIALTNAIQACAELQIDSTPMEGFAVEKVNDLLQLAPQGLNACVLLAVGYRDNNDLALHSKKMRKPIDRIFYEV